MSELPSKGLAEAAGCELDRVLTFEVSPFREERLLDREVREEVTVLSRDFISACMLSSLDQHAGLDSLV